MRLIKFKTIELQNFLSYGEKKTVIDLQSGVNLITGRNLDKEDSKNGSGKSSLCCDSIHFALYGTTLRDVAKEFIPNALTSKKCIVSLEFDVVTDTTTSFKVVRTLNPSACKVYMNGEDVTRSTLIKTNNYIQKILRTPSTVFQNSVVMAVNATKPFMALSKVEKRKFIESVLGLEVFTQMVLAARDEYAVCRKDYEIAFNKQEQVSKELAFVTEQLNLYSKNKREQIKDLKDKKKTLETDIKTINRKIADLEKSVEDCELLKHQEGECKAMLKGVLQKSSTYKLLIRDLTREHSDIENKISVLEEHKDKCPECMRPYEKNSEHVTATSVQIEKLQELKLQKLSLIKETEEKIDKCIKIEETIEAELDRLSAQLYAVNTKSIELSSKKASLQHVKRNLAETEEALEKVKAQQNAELVKRRKQLFDENAALTELVHEKNENLNLLETVRYVISEDGIKAFLVKKIIKVLNSRLAFYLKALDANCLCQFDEFFNEHVIDENRHEKSYFNFSAGERKRVDLACLFAFADIRRLQGDVYFSTVFYDELLDSSLDDKGVQLTVDVLRNRFEDLGESCYIITHRGTDLASKANHCISVEKRNGISYIAS